MTEAETMSDAAGGAVLPASASSEANVAAVVVTYQPSSELPSDVVENLRQLQSQVRFLVVVDNGSSVDALTSLEEAARSVPFALIVNGRNLGIATALNVGISRVQAEGAEWVLLFDQDSRVTEGFAAAMLRSAAKPRRMPLGILVPQFRDFRDARELHEKRLGEGELEEAITSGSLMTLATLARLGPFADELFIDGVDHEMSLRVRKAGLLIDQCPEAVLLHSPGTPTEHRLLWKSFQTSNYSPVRRYYQERNKVWMIRRYAAAFPGYCLRLTISTVREGVKILLVEKDKATKLRFFFRGLIDGLRNRMGPYRAR